VTTAVGVGILKMEEMIFTSAINVDMIMKNKK
jgi:hypothetical protein